MGYMEVGGQMDMPRLGMDVLGSVEDGNEVAVLGGNGIWTMVQRLL